MSAGQTLTTGSRQLAVEHGQRRAVARDLVIREVPFQLPAQRLVLFRDRLMPANPTPVGTVGRRP